MILNAKIKENIIKAAEVIKGGGLVAFPTETVYGLGADGLNPIAAAKIFEAKERPAFNPLILHISDFKILSGIAEIRNPKAEILIKKFWPGPLTLVLPKKESVPDIVTSGHPTVAVRMPSNDIALEFIRLCGTPVAAPSANRFGRLSPTTAQHVEKQLADKVDLILDGGKTSIGVESTILQIDEEEISLLRHGGLSIEEIENEIGRIKSGKHNTQNPNSPGQLPFHYSPVIPTLFLNKKNYADSAGKKIGILYFKNPDKNLYCHSEKILSQSGDMREAAANLFLMLHEFEKENVEIILIEAVEERGLGKAIMDRMEKAVNRYTA